MAARALVIAIESYSRVKQAGIASVLPGTLEAGIAFREWMLNNWKLEGRSAEDYQLLFCSEPPQGFGTGASRRDILEALHKIRKEGQSTTDTFHFFFSGHGFSFVERPGSRADILLSSDFEDAQLSSDCCFNLDEVISWLRDRLGPGKHYYFIDACRNKLNSTQIQVGKFLVNDVQVSEEASTFLLQSTVDGAVAAVADTFPKALLDGLRGKGKAKVWDPQVSDAMLVKYESLRSYLADLLKSKQAISSKVEGPEGPSDAVLATLRPIPMSTCEVQIVNGSGREHGEVVVIRGRAGVGEHRPVTSPTFSMSLEPDRYFISLQLRNASVEPATPVEVDLYENRKLVFTKVGAPRPAVVSEAANAPLTTEVDIVLPTKTELRLRNMHTGHEIRFPASCKSTLPQGRYVAEFRGPNDRMLRSEELELAAQPAKVAFADWARSAPHVAIAQRLPQSNGGVEFSESLGEAITDTDLNLWLALLGGGRILGSQGDYSKLARFPLRDFMSETKGASPIYVLAGFDDATTRLQVGLSNDENVQWIEASEPPGLQGIREAYIATPPGPHLLSFRRADEAPYTIATVASPNRAMLVVLTVDEDGNLAVAQYLLPIGHLVDELPGFVKNLLRARNQLSDLRLLAQASRSFRQRRDAFKLVPPNELDALLYGKWLNPIASCMAAYEFLRRGNKQDMQIVVQNLKSFFADLPDTTALARLIGAPDDKPPSVPIFADGLKAYPDDLSWLPLPAGHLDFGSVWTAWRVAVR